MTLLVVAIVVWRRQVAVWESIGQFLPAGVQDRVLDEVLDNKSNCPVATMFLRSMTTVLWSVHGTASSRNQQAEAVIDQKQG